MTRVDTITDRGRKSKYLCTCLVCASEDFHHTAQPSSDMSCASFISNQTKRRVKAVSNSSTTAAYTVAITQHSNVLMNQLTGDQRSSLFFILGTLCRMQASTTTHPNIRLATTRGDSKPLASPSCCTVLLLPHRHGSVLEIIAPSCKGRILLRRAQYRRR